MAFYNTHTNKKRKTKEKKKTERKKEVCEKEKSLFSNLLQFEVICLHLKKMQPNHYNCCLVSFSGHSYVYHWSSTLYCGHLP